MLIQNRREEIKSVEEREKFKKKKKQINVIT